MNNQKNFSEVIKRDDWSGYARELIRRKLVDGVVILPTSVEADCEKVVFAKSFLKWLDETDFIFSGNKIVFRTFGHDALRTMDALHMHLDIVFNSLHWFHVAKIDDPISHITKHVPRISAIIDDHVEWVRNGENEKFGKRFWIIPSLRQIFVDDNYRYDVDDERNIISPYELVDGKWVHTKNLPNNHSIVVADRYDILTNERWFMDNIPSPTKI